MKIVLAAILLFCVLGATAQSIQVLEAKTAHTLQIGDEARTVIKLKNVSDQPVHVLVRRDEIQIGSSQKSFFCWDGDCEEPNINATSVSRVIQPGEIVETFVSILEAGLDETISSMKYVFYNRDEPSDRVEVELNYTVSDQPQTGTMYESNFIRLSDIYPNPVGESAFLDYIVYDPETEARIVFHNILGSQVGQYDLNPLESDLKINTQEYKPGVYFYTLYVNNEGKVTKKLIIRR